MTDRMTDGMKATSRRIFVVFLFLIKVARDTSSYHITVVWSCSVALFSYQTVNTIRAARPRSVPPAYPFTQMPARLRCSSETTSEAKLSHRGRSQESVHNSHNQRAVWMGLLPLYTEIWRLMDLKFITWGNRSPLLKQTSQSQPEGQQHSNLGSVVPSSPVAVPVSCCNGGMCRMFELLPSELATPSATTPTREKVTCLFTCPSCFIVVSFAVQLCWRWWWGWWRCEGRSSGAAVLQATVWLDSCNAEAASHAAANAENIRPSALPTGGLTAAPGTNVEPQEPEENTEVNTE